MLALTRMGTRENPEKRDRAPVWKPIVASRCQRNQMPLIMHAARPFTLLGIRTHKARGANIFVKVSKYAKFERSTFSGDVPSNSFPRERHVPSSVYSKAISQPPNAPWNSFLCRKRASPTFNARVPILSSPRNESLILITDPVTHRLLLSQTPRGRPCKSYRSFFFYTRVTHRVIHRLSFVFKCQLHLRFLFSLKFH